jgi:hypothetical protein
MLGGKEFGGKVIVGEENGKRPQLINEMRADEPKVKILGQGFCFQLISD